MPTEIVRPTFSFSYSLLLLLCALACFVAGECLVQGWLTLGVPWGWGFGGFAFLTLAKIL